MSTAYSDLSQAEACAEIIVRYLNKNGGENVVHAGRTDDIIRIWVQGNGFHLGNVVEDFDVDPHLLCNAEGLKPPEEEDVDVSDAEAFLNAVVQGPKEYPEKTTLPTHTTRLDGVVRKENTYPETDALVRQAGFDV